MITNPAVGNLGKSEGATSFIQKAIPAAISLAFLIGAIVFFFMLLMGGISWISSGGDKQKLEEARGRVSNAIIGLVILFATFAVIKIIGAFFHIDILNLTVPTLVSGT
jgi:Zn-dependent protease